MNRILSFVHTARVGIACLALSGFSASAVAPLDVRVALVIGNSAYEGDAALDNPANDATAMADALKRLGFAVTQVRDGSRNQMVDAIQSMGKSLHEKSGVGMLYYAGHGVQMNWRNYLVPVNARLTSATDVSEQSVDLELVMKTFRAAASRMNIVVLDACRDNPFPIAGSVKGLAQMDAPPGTFLAYATAPGNVAEDGTVGSNGLYTGYLLRELTRPVSKIEDVFKRVRLQVRQTSKGRQVPWESTSLEEDFFFNDGVKHTFKAEDLDQLNRQARARVLEMLHHADKVRLQEQIAAAEQASEREQQLAVKRQQEFERVSAAEASTGNLSKKQSDELAFQREKADWDRIAKSRNPDDFYDFLLRYPSGSISELASATLERLASAHITPVADRDGMVQVPGKDRFRLGDKHYFQFRDDLKNTTRLGMMQVTAVNDETVEVNEGRDVYTREGGTIRNALVSKLDPPRLDLPAGDYTIGKRWKYRSNKTVSVGAFAGQPFMVEGSSRITALESVTVPAGTFKAYRIELEEFSEFGDVHVRITRWMLPDWGFPIKMQRELRRRWGGPELDSMVMTFRERVGS